VIKPQLNFVFQLDAFVRNKVIFIIFYVTTVITVMRRIQNVSLFTFSLF
jgi:hypothetical protein